MNWRISWFWWRETSWFRRFGLDSFRWVTEVCWVERIELACWVSYYWQLYSSPSLFINWFFTSFSWSLAFKPRRWISFHFFHALLAKPYFLRGSWGLTAMGIFRWVLDFTKWCIYTINSLRSIKILIWLDVRHSLRSVLLCRQKNTLPRSEAALQAAADLGPIHVNLGSYRLTFEDCFWTPGTTDSLIWW